MVVYGEEEPMISVYDTESQCRGAKVELEGESSSLLFAGDFILDHVSCSETENSVAEAIFDDRLRGHIRDADVSVVNLEGPLGGSGGEIAKVGRHMAQGCGVVELLGDIGFDVLTLANSHMMDYGEAALGDTLEAASQAGLGTVGAGMSGVDAVRPIERVLPNGKKVAIFSFCEHEFGINDGGAGTAWISDYGVEGAIESAKCGGAIVIVCAHGGVERMPLPPAQRREQLRRIVDWGADVVIGHHSHVPQGWERYGNGYIFYGLGDLYFDHRGITRSACSMWGYMVRVGVRANGLSGLQIIPYERVGCQVVELGVERDREEHLEYLYDLSALTSDVDFEAYWQAISGRLMSSRYEVGFRQAFPRVFAAPESVVQAVQALGRTLWRFSRRRFGMSVEGVETKEADRVIRWRRSMLLNMIRCESHRCAIETAMSLESGDCKDLRSEESRKIMNETIKRMSA